MTRPPSEITSAPVRAKPAPESSPFSFATTSTEALSVNSGSEVIESMNSPVNSTASAMISLPARNRNSPFCSVTSANVTGTVSTNPGTSLS